MIASKTPNRQRLQVKSMTRRARRWARRSRRKTLKRLARYSFFHDVPLINQTGCTKKLKGALIFFVSFVPTFVLFVPSFSPFLLRKAEQSVIRLWFYCNPAFSA